VQVKLYWGSLPYWLADRRRSKADAQFRTERSTLSGADLAPNLRDVESELLSQVGLI